MANEAPKSILETVLAKAHEKAIPIELAPLTETPVKKPETIVAPVVKTEDFAKQLEAERAKVAELTAKLGETEKTVTDLQPIAKARELWKSKKRIEAIEMLSGTKEIDPELDEFVAEYVKSPSKETKNAVEDKLDQLLDKEKKRDEQAAKAKEDEAKAKEQGVKDAAEKAKRDNVAYTASVLDKHAGDFDLCSREGNKPEVCVKAPIIALECLRRDKVDLATLTLERAEKAMIEALSEIEAELEKEGIARFLKKSKETPTTQVHVTTEKTPDPANRVPPPVIKVSDSKRPASVSDVIEAARKRALYQ